MAAARADSGQLQIDATVGGGGHAERILEASTPDGRLARPRCRPGGHRPGRAIRLGPVRRPPRPPPGELPRALATVAPAAGFGPSTGSSSTSACSSYQLADVERGFGFRAGGPLDMRFDTASGVPAAELLATLDARELTAPLPRATARSRSAGRIARAIVDDRAHRARSTRPRTWPRSSTRVVPANPRRPPPDPSRDARLPGAPHRRQRASSSAAARPPWPPPWTCSGRAAGWSSSATTRSRTASSSASCTPNGAAASARPTCRSASAAASPDCGPSARSREPRAPPRSPPTPAPGAPGCGPPNGSPPEPHRAGWRPAAIAIAAATGGTDEHAIRRIVVGPTVAASTRSTNARCNRSTRPPAPEPAEPE